MRISDWSSDVCSSDLVQDAVGFARMLAERQGKLDELERAMAKGEETFVELPREIPVRLPYHTAYVGPGGRVLFRPDPYGWDEDPAAPLCLGVRARPGAPLPLNLHGPGLFGRPPHPRAQ